MDDLLVAWQQTRDHWTDQQARQFEETYLRRIAEELGATGPAISQISQVFGTAHRDCSE